MSDLRAKRLNRSRLPVVATQQFCGTKALASALLRNLGAAMIYADDALSKNESEDTEFEIQFWDGRLAIDSDTMFDVGIRPDTIDDLSRVRKFDDKLDATIILGITTNGRKFIAVRWEFKEDEYSLTAWWLRKPSYSSR